MIDTRIIISLVYDENGIREKRYDDNVILQIPPVVTPSSKKLEELEEKAISSQALDKNIPCVADESKELKKQEKIEQNVIEKAIKLTTAEDIQQKTPNMEETTNLADEEVQITVEPSDQRDLYMCQRYKITEFIREVAKLGLEGMKEEFIYHRSFIPYAATKTAHDNNLIRCRYPDVICIDQTRIILRIGDEKSDFIHASRIPLGDNPNEIIITQLPLSNTVKQFWEMIWQENVQAILVFLTLKEWKEHGENIRLIPKKGKCLHIKGLIMLTHKNELQITSHWILQEFYLSKNNETRRILWHHYTGWEPNKPPVDSNHLWPLHSSLRKMRRPYVCISLAGIGRAGCYAALEWAHEMLHNKNTSAINIVECLKKIRTYRMHAIQSVSQYQFVYMGIQRHIFLVEKIRKEILSHPAILQTTRKCAYIEHQYYQCGDRAEEYEFNL